MLQTAARSKQLRSLRTPPARAGRAASRAAVPRARGPSWPPFLPSRPALRPRVLRLCLPLVPARPPARPPREPGRVTTERRPRSRGDAATPGDRPGRGPRAGAALAHFPGETTEVLVFVPFFSPFPSHIRAL